MATILLVEDNLNQRLLYQMVLEDEGYDVLIALDAQEVLEQIETEHPDLTILDPSMFNGDSREILTQIIKSTPQMSVVIQTAYAYLDGDPLIEVADGYVVKSSDLAPLKDVIHRVLLKR